MLAVNDLTKRIGKEQVLDGVSFVVGDGELFTLVGPLEAGKTTLMKIIIGAVKPDRGSVILNGIDCINQVELARNIYGYVPETLGMYEYLTVEEYMSMFAELNNMNFDDMDINGATFLMENLTAFAGLTAKNKEYIRNLSRAEKVRLSIARALLRHPSVLLLDNPLHGLDMNEVLLIREMLGYLTSTNRTIIMTSDNIQLSAGISTSIAIIDEGRMLSDQEMMNVMEKLKSRHM